MTRWVERFSARTHHKTARPATFLVDEKGVVRFAHAGTDSSVRVTAVQILKRIDDVFAPAK